LKKHQAEWLGGLGDIFFKGKAANDWFPSNEFQFARGWLDRLNLVLLTPARAKILAELPTARLLRELAIGSLDAFRYGGDEAEEPADSSDALEILTGAPLRSLRVLQLGGRQKLEDDTWDYQYSFGPESFLSALDLVENQPLLEELYIRGDISG